MALWHTGSGELVGSDRCQPCLSHLQPFSVDPAAVMSMHLSKQNGALFVIVSANCMQAFTVILLTRRCTRLYPVWLLLKRWCGAVICHSFLPSSGCAISSRPSGVACFTRVSHLLLTSTTVEMRGLQLGIAAHTKSFCTARLAPHCCSPHFPDTQVLQVKGEVSLNAKWKQPRAKKNSTLAFHFVYVCTACKFGYVDLYWWKILQIMAFRFVNLALPALVHLNHCKTPSA